MAIWEFQDRSVGLQQGNVGQNPVTANDVLLETTFKLGDVCALAALRGEEDWRRGKDLACCQGEVEDDTKGKGRRDHDGCLCGVWRISCARKGSAQTDANLKCWFPIYTRLWIGVINFKAPSLLYLSLCLLLFFWEGNVICLLLLSKQVFISKNYASYWNMVVSIWICALDSMIAMDMQGVKVGLNQRVPGSWLVQCSVITKKA